MKESVLVVATVCLFFGGSVLASYCLFWYLAKRQTDPAFEEGASVRMVGPGGSYRCHFLRSEDEALVFSSPLQADRYVPIRVGERLLVTGPSFEGVASFRSVVLERDASAHELWIKTPNFVSRSDRRGAVRSHALKGEDVLLNGELALIEDHSPGGACVLAADRPVAGSIVRVSLPSRFVDAYGWLVDSAPAAFGRSQGYRLHIQFQEEQDFATKSRRKRHHI